MSVVRATGLAVRVSPSDLQDALNDFQSKLETADRLEFNKKLPVLGASPDASAVINLITKLDQANRARKGRCLASRLHVILESINQFTLVVSTFVSSNPPIAALVWGSVQFTLVLASRSFSRFERISELLMEIGRDCPRFESYQRIFQDSEGLQNALCTYYSSIVKICTDLYLDMRQPEPFWKELYANPLSPFTSKSLLQQTEIRALARNVTAEIKLADVRSRDDERKSKRKLSARKREREKRDERLDLMNRLLNYDYKTSLTQLQGKRCNNTVEWLDDDPIFKKWRTSPESSILWLTAKLGGGKSVMMAHAVSLLYLHHAKPTSRITYMFCRFDDQATRSASLVLRCLIRQCLDESTMSDDVEQMLSECLDGKMSDVTFLQKFLVLVVASIPCHFAIVDGLDDMDETEQSTLCEALRFACENSPQTFKVMLSCRHHAPSRLCGKRVELIQYAPPRARVRKDIEAYIDFALTTKVENEQLATGDPALIGRIDKTLLDGAEEMFLWVELMLLEICSQPTDDHIRRILEKPPTTLTELYCLVLSRIAAIGRSKEAIDCFKFVAVAKRPLAVDELQEAMAVEPYAKASQPGRLINNISQIFTWFGGLVIREEINDTVRFVHSTVLQAISDQRQISPQKWAYINPQQADKDVGIVCATYLNFDDFKTQVAHRSKLQDVDAAVLLDASLQEATPLLAKFLQSLPSRRLQRQQLPISRIPELAGTALSNRTLRTDDNTHPLLEYASIYWLSHSRHFSNVERIWSLWKPLLSDDHQLAKKPSEITRDPRKLKEEIIHQWHFALLLWDQLGQRSLDAQNITLIINYACDARATTFLSSFFNHCAQLPLDSNILFKVFSTVAESRDQDIARIISNSQFVNDTTNHRTFRHDHMFLRFQREYDLVLHLAVIAGDTELIRNLADGVNVDGIVALEGGRYSGRWSALSAAASIGNSAAVKILVGFGADINAYVNLRFTALGAAAHSGHAEVVGELLSLGANVNAAPAMYYGRTALQASAEGGHMEIVAKFLSIGAHVNAAPAEYRGRTALQAAAGSGHTEVVAKLLSIGADVNAAPAEFDGRTALQAAAGNRHTEIVAQLLTAGADVNAAPANLYGRTALQAAAESGDAVLVAQLLSTGADVNAAPAEIDGRTALQFAAGIGHAVVVAKLLSAGADVNAAPAKFDGRTALQAAAANNHCNVLAKLISAGADVNAAPAEFDGRTALQAAAEHGHAEIVTELLSAGADVNAAPAKSKGRTALQAARETGTAEIARLLLAASAEETEY